MKKFINIYFVLIFSFIGVGCSSLSEKIDIAGIIDSTENWLFSEKSNTSKGEEETIEKSNNVEKDEEEVFPDISDIPQDRPNFEELDKDFFEEDEATQTEELLTSSKADSLVNSEIEPEENLSVVKKNILAVLNMRESIRLNVVKLLINSDPLVDQKTSLIKEKDIIELGDKKAIIQFPDNSIIPDQSAYDVIEEIIKIIGIDKNIKLIGHASRTGSNNTIGKRKNMEISIAMADTIKNIFINKGFQASRLITSGKGDLEPLKEEVQEFGEAVNRRVEVFFISN